MIRLGLDNGLGGAIVGLNRHYEAVLQYEMPVIPGPNRVIDLVALHAILQEAKAIGGGDVYAVLEYAQAMPKQGGVSMFNFGMGFGATRALLIALEIAHEIRQPKAWHKDVGVVMRRKPKIRKGVPVLTDKGKPMTEPDKQALKQQAIAICQRRLPTLNLKPPGKRTFHDGLADAGCMALTACQLRPFSGQVIAFPTQKRKPPPIPNRSE